ncbi:MAG TPA: hypothetical protein VF748_14495 [Candidatus Acidoferrum sp.]
MKVIIVAGPTGHCSWVAEYTAPHVFHWRNTSTGTIVQPPIDANDIDRFYSDIETDSRGKSGSNPHIHEVHT